MPAHSVPSTISWRACRLVITAITVVSVTAPTPASADSCAPLLSGVTSASGASSITLTGVNNGASVNSNTISSAGSSWNNSCSSYDNPSFQTSGGGDMTVQVQFYSGTDAQNNFSCGGSCGCTATTITNGAVSGATVRLFSQQANGVSCGSAQAEVLTHELGHVLGLGDSSCSGRIMGDVFGSIASGDCTAVDGNFLTDAEKTTDPEGPGGDGPCAV